MLNAGDTLGDYEILGLLGKGGMGEVYHARDPRLDRSVAIKVLPENFAKEEERLIRFAREARLLAAVNHPNIATVHDFHDEGEHHFLVMELVGGKSLGDYIFKNLPSTLETVRFFTQLAEGLKAAHDAGVVHRDLKPDNIQIQDGKVKILDFGLAKEGMTQPGAAGTDTPTVRMSPSPGIVTEAGMVMGTPMYMSPEQARGKELDERTDIWAFGCCLYETLTGHVPFQGDTAADILGSVLTREPDLSKLGNAIPRELKGLVRDCLQKDPEKRPRNMDEIIDRLELIHAKVVPVNPNRQAAPYGLLAVMALIIIAIAAYTIINLPEQKLAQDPAETQGRSTEELIPALFTALDTGQLNEAFEIAKRIEAADPDNPMLEPLWVRMSDTREIITEPPGATVSYARFHDDEPQWEELGTTPLEVRIPLDPYQLKFELEEHRTLEIAQTTFFHENVPERLGVPTLKLTLLPDDADHPDMVQVPASDKFGTPIYGEVTSEVESVEEFLIDQFEVTNREFKEFIDAGGYTNPEYWTEPFELDDETLAFEDAMAKFTDTVGQRGPAGWELGDYPAGQDDYPVGGVSWYEAMAYAKFRGKTLPTALHWASALFMDFEPVSALGPEVSLHANQTTGTVLPVGTAKDIGTSGARDMAGNQREWVLNFGSDVRYTLGSSWDDPSYSILRAFPRSPWDRSIANGIRCAVYLEGGPSDQAATQQFTQTFPDFSQVKPMSDDALGQFARLASYESEAFELAHEFSDTTNRNYDLEVVSVNGVDGRRFEIEIFLPKDLDRKAPPIIFFPGLLSVMPGEIDRDHYLRLFDFVPKSGRALVIPHYRHLWEDSDGTTIDKLRTPNGGIVIAREWIQDVTRTLEYLRTRSDIADGTGYMGFSLGSVMGNVILPALNDEFVVNISVAGGFASENNAALAPHITIPTLMVNGRTDFIMPYEQVQVPMFNMLGTPPEHKKHVVLDCGHLPEKAGLVREALAWLEKYQPLPDNSDE